jgi:hypothetical protein
MRMRAGVIALVMLAAPGWAAAQVFEPPPRSSGGMFGAGPPPEPNRVRQELTLQGSVLGGYDDNLTPPSGGNVTTSYPSGYIGFGDETLTYRVGKNASSMEVSGRAYMNLYQNLGLGPSYGAEQRLRVRTIGRRTQVEASQGLRYAPYFSVGLFGVMPNDVGAQNPDRNPANALTESRSWATDASASLVHQFTRRTSMNLGYDFSKQTYVQGVGFDSQTQAGSVGLSRSIGRTLAILAMYRQSDSEFIEHQDRSKLPLVTRTAHLGLRYLRHVSRTREVSFSGGAGAMDADTVEASTRKPVHLWGPSGSGTVRLDVGHSWSLAGDYERSVSVLQGIAPEAFVSDAGIIRAGGLLQRWLETVFTAGYSNGLAGQGTSGGAPGRYDGYSGMVQLRFLMTRSWSSVVSVNHFQYRLNTEASQSLGISPDMHRNALRVGFTWSLPLFGRAAKRPEPLSGSRN